MGDKKSSVARKVISETISQMPDNERAEVLDWAQRSLVVVQNNNLSKAQKFLQLQKIKSTKPVLRLIFAIARLLKVKAWDRQSWARRLGVGGLAAGAVAFGTQGAGVAAMGTAIGVPLALISGAGAALLGLIIDEIKKEHTS